MAPGSFSGRRGVVGLAQRTDGYAASEAPGKDSGSEAWPPRAALRILAMFALLLGLTLAAAPSASASADAFIKAYGWGVADGLSQFETCTTTCQAGLLGGGAGQLAEPQGVAIDHSGDVYVTDDYGDNNSRIDEFSAAGSFIKAYGWGVADGASQFETCTSTCRQGISGGGAGQLSSGPSGVAGVAIDSAGDVYVADDGNNRIDEFSAAGSFIKAYGWGVADGASQFEICTGTCRQGISGGGAGQLNLPTGVVIDSSGDLYVADGDNPRIDEFSAAGSFIKAYGWGVADGASQLETCTGNCRAGLRGGGAGELGVPWGVAIDSSGDVYVADRVEDRIDEFSAAGVFVKAYGWGVADGMDQFETCTTTCQPGFVGGGAGELYQPEGVAIDSSGDVYVADEINDRIDEFSAAGAFIRQAGIGGGGAGQFDTPEGVAIDSSGDIYVADTFNDRIDEFSAAGALSPVSPVSPAPPANTTAPKVTGSAKADGTLSCSRGSWTNNPTSYAYQWYRNGTLLAGFTTSTYRLGTLDEGTTLKCVVTASNVAGQASATSNAVTIPIPKVARCPAATGSMTGTTIGQIRLGMTRSRARYLYRRHSNRGRQYQDFFCLTPIGVRAGYASPSLRKGLSRREQAKVTGTVVWASVSNPYYSLDGIRAGESIATASRVLGTERPFHIGLNYWYLARKATYTAVLKVRGGVVEELGIADNALTTSRALQSTLMHSFY